MNLKRLSCLSAALFAALMLSCSPTVEPEDPENPENPEVPENPEGPGGGGTEIPDAPEAYGATPTAAQVEWQKMETNMFIHFGPNTFTNMEWGTGDASEVQKFNPTTVDCDSWVSIAKETGFKGIILTAKHHDGFCLWPNALSTHTIAYSPYKNGKGDILKELSDACAKQGVKFGVYDSPWDMQDPTYGQGAAYNNRFAETIKDLHTNYGDIFEQWFDGAKGSDGKPQEYDFNLFNSSVLDIHPDAIIFSNVGPGCRWVGNEYGFARETNWSTFTPSQYGASQSDLPGSYGTYLGSGTENGKFWMPAESDVSIRTKGQQDNGDPLWFWNSLTRATAGAYAYVRSAKNLMKLYYQSVGRNSLLLLNVPPTTAGVFDDRDIASLRGFKEMRDKIFATNLAEGAEAEAGNVRGDSENFAPANMIDGNYDTYFATDDNVKTVEITFNLKQSATFNRVLLQEYIPLGQRVKSFTVSYKSGNTWRTLKTATTIGYKRILLTDRVTTDAVKISITSSLACPVLNGFGLYDDSVSGLTDSNLDKQ